MNLQLRISRHFSEKCVPKTKAGLKHPGVLIRRNRRTSCDILHVFGREATSPLWLIAGVVSWLLSVCLSAVLMMTSAACYSRVPTGKLE